MRILKGPKHPSNQPQQDVLLEDDKYTYRIFCISQADAAYKVIVEYDQRADLENMVGESEGEGPGHDPIGQVKNNPNRDAGL